MAFFQKGQQYDFESHLLDKSRSQDGGIFAIPILIDQHLERVTRILARLPDIGNGLYQRDHQVESFPYVESGGRFFELGHKSLQYIVVARIGDIDVISGVIERARERLLKLIRGGGEIVGERPRSTTIAP